MALASAADVRPELGKRITPGYPRPMKHCAPFGLTTVEPGAD